MVGAGGFGRVVSELARLSYDCTFVDDGFPVGASVCGIPVVGKVLSLPCLRSSYSLLIVTIGDNQVREKIYRKAMDLGFCFPTLVHPSAFVSPFVNVNHFFMWYGKQIFMFFGNEFLHHCGKQIFMSGGKHFFI